MNNTDVNSKSAKNQRAQRERRERGPPADGIPSKTKVMVANLPYDLTEEQVSVKRAILEGLNRANGENSFSNSSRLTSPRQRRSLSAPFLDS